MTKITIQTIRDMKARGEKIPALTAYDYPMARLLDAAGIPFLLVGDSLGMVVLGYPDTTHVTMSEMEHHVRAVARARPAALVGADLPFKSCETPAAAVENARRLVNAGAEFVKMEGGLEMLPQARAIIAAGVPCCGHLGMLPQSVLEEGGYHVKGKTEAARARLVDDAKALTAAGAFAIVLELVAPSAARDVARAVAVPVIGIGSGDDCDGQILVTPDLLGLSPDFIPRHVKKNFHLARRARFAIMEWKQTVQCIRNE
ncbi:MAG: 3-methyl-2-oxobutanoate hydroxymethyltransferase [Verrucomicrobia bacterium]|nr:3-methyl-2-oxobutanoate hydroxymethyltransferase [Verrucomicrobiota bacterium]MDE3098549.1 3-methyl-2-oxobutanoate hydroxymethyltransferase [Verrucomicrobiota bacterium]